MRIELELQKRHREGLTEGLAMGRLEGLAEGSTKKLIEQICKKLAKGKSPQTIAEELEEDLDMVEKVCRAVQPFAPDYNVEAIYVAMHPKL